MPSLEPLHIVPAEGSDLVGHQLDDQCVCGPRVELHARGQLVIHHALDGREAADPDTVPWCDCGGCGNG